MINMQNMFVKVGAAVKKQLHTTRHYKGLTASLLVVPLLAHSCSCFFVHCMAGCMQVKAGYLSCNIVSNVASVVKL